MRFQILAGRAYDHDMTAVIGRRARRLYCPRMPGMDDIQRIAATLERPGQGYVRRVQRALIASSAHSGEPRRRVESFLERVADLTLQELTELYDETFRHGRLPAIEPLAACLVRRRIDADGARAALNVLAPALERLERERNPFSYLVKDLCCALLTRAGASHLPAM
jgi:hypothetical protein